MTVKPYQNEPVIDWTTPERSAELKKAIAQVRSQFGKTYPLFIDGQAVTTERVLPSLNPSKHAEVVGHVSQATRDHIDRAIAAASRAFETWSQTSFQERAMYLFKAAQIMRDRKAELMAWQILESGKNWAEADGDVNEAIDFLEFYARSAIELDKGQELIPWPGEDNRMMYIPLGVGVVIPPWNFPLAILTGTVVSALVTGNTVLLKPSPLSSVMAAKFVEIMQELHLPAGVLNFVPGDPAEIGDYMTGHPDVRFISFTGSKQVGLHIDEVAHRRSEKQRWIKRVVAEMGGKDGSVVDETADLDWAAAEIVAAAFGFQGQKCSAGSRAIIHEAVYDELVAKIVERASQLTVGPAEENPNVGPVIDAKAFQKITQYIEIGKGEGRLVLGGEADDSTGYFVKPTIFVDVDPKARIMQEEIFGPVLGICKVSSFEEGVRVFNDTEYGLTGAVFSRKRERLEYARRHMHCGNLYFNRRCTGSLVGVQPFGGFDMSGTDAKAGSKDYLLNFVQPKTVTERF
ncbi:L-glutamate gamma-semialdehyde dehydrogenase [Alicyclobacillus cycloheptanicus]|uniref:L-glutamate gamma-semialdehyde dehydrogenase n=1 Tax=Alicyclobacillus cycloheptanicus TaxID=1457 RepID=A0ABT9XGU6_9BACL|nr:L-glutamate gamma-semialdehyde dehydrogenase [Alicyclobacillus cycloheptanicus]MDQ0189033.1 1-pyrroline-5-carboxylate dehydrogenase [Alicyclobacillus cycloheptanicus]WDM00171.1 L-glutamate gamma-semialdehyde dehydrogenase [Alicyclobacillus cycloheptanicus]